MTVDMEETSADVQFEPQAGCCEDCDDELARRRKRPRDGGATSVVAAGGRRRLAMPPAIRARLRIRFVRGRRWRYRRDAR